jgi:hypothetical protein
MADTYKRAFESYYSLKRQYDAKIARQKRQITSNASLSLAEKQEAIRELKHKCINCNRHPGTVFRQEGKRLIAHCANTESPCNLDIDITRGGYEPTSYMRSFFREITELRKTEIVEAKLNLLFGYETEEDSMTAFESRLREYKEGEDMLTTIDSGIDAVVNDLGKQADLAGKELELYKAVETIKELILKHREDPKTHSGVFGTIAEIMVGQVAELNEQIRNLKYSTNRIIFDESDGTHHLEQIPYQMGEIEIDLFDEPVVSKYKTGKTAKADAAI